MAAIFAWRRTGLRRPSRGERLGLGLRRDDAGKLVVYRGGQRLERGIVTRTGEDEVVRRCSEGGTDRLRAVLDQPETELRVVGRMVPQRPCNPEDQVVPGFVGEKQRRGSLEESGRVIEAANVHRGIVGAPHNYNPPRS